MDEVLQGDEATKLGESKMPTHANNCLAILVIEALQSTVCSDADTDAVVDDDHQTSGQVDRRVDGTEGQCPAFELGGFARGDRG